jgi:hypothetical protein
MTSRSIGCVCSSPALRVRIGACGRRTSRLLRRGRSFPTLRATSARGSRSDADGQSRTDFGGVATALKIFNELADALGDEFDRRIVITEADIAPEG